MEGIEKITGWEGFDLKVLKVVVKAFNEVGVLEKKIKVVAIKTLDLVEAFITGIEGVAEGSPEEKKIPKECVDLYNIYVDLLEDKKPEKEKEKKEEKEKSVASDGTSKIWREGSSARQVYDIIATAKKGITLEGATEKFEKLIETGKVESSNPSSRVTAVFKEAVKRGLAVVADGKYSIKG